MATPKQSPGWVQALSRPVDLRALVGRPKAVTTRGRGRGRGRDVAEAAGRDPLHHLAEMVVVTELTGERPTDQPATRRAALAEALAEAARAAAPRPA